ncbi:male-specific histamine-binding salivary protein-like [Rhipicephalus sanguineus]|uniref:male-specific histamine-binding salivary protein-like n=1 Tax=Rhipicephalus sanguineus TaxID=34632 RepID=UPI0018961293|nr:male-specific histamine-binding salivary protein-like [Rhipicephalus sanguineus]XP_037524917.1 male-specific histamine-binding salivary protein-like [Rhipicephalus sanguineus]
MMRCTLLVFLFHVGFGDVQKEDLPPWADETSLGKYQDAWRTLNQSNTTVYFLVRSTYSENPVWGKNFTCVNVRAIEVNETAKTVKSLFRFKNGTTGKTYNLTDTVGVTTTYNYSTPNAIQYTTDNGTLNDTLIFSDYNRCDIVSIPYENNGTGCEMWVNKDHVNNIPDCCNFIYDAYCVSAGNYTVYEQTSCKDMLDQKASEAC